MINSHVNPFVSTATQKDMVLSYLLSGKPITHLKAQSEFKVVRLAAVIHQLRGDGYRIGGNWNTSFTGRRFKEYTLM